MVHILSASSLSRVIEKFDYNSKRTLKKTITAIPGLSFNQNNKNDLKVNPTLLSKGRLSKTSKKEKFIIWHDAVNNSISRHPSNFNTRLTPKQLQRILIHYKHCISLRFNYLGRCLGPEKSLQVSKLCSPDFLVTPEI